MSVKEEINEMTVGSLDRDLEIMGLAYYKTEKGDLSSAMEFMTG